MTAVRIVGLLLFAAGLAWSVYWGVRLQQMKKAKASWDDRWAVLGRGQVGILPMVLGLVIVAVAS